MHKDFHSWSKIKEKLNNKDRYPVVKHREVWWCSLGVNVGDEEDGKGVAFSRPVLVVRKFNKRVFLGVPLSTQIKEKNYYHQISFHGKEQSVILSQIRLWDSKRLTSKMGQISRNQFEDVRNLLKEMI